MLVCLFASLLAGRLARLFSVFSFHRRRLEASSTTTTRHPCLFCFNTSRQPLSSLCPGITQMGRTRLRLRSTSPRRGGGYVWWRRAEVKGCRCVFVCFFCFCLFVCLLFVCLFFPAKGRLANDLDVTVHWGGKLGFLLFEIFNKTLHSEKGGHFNKCKVNLLWFEGF